MDNVFVAGQFLQAAWAAGVKTIGADADFRAESKLASVIKSGAGVDEHGGRIDAGRKLARRGKVEITGHVVVAWEKTKRQQ